MEAALSCFVKCKPFLTKKFNSKKIEKIEKKKFLLRNFETKEKVEKYLSTCLAYDVDDEVEMTKYLKIFIPSSRNTKK